MQYPQSHGGRFKASRQASPPSPHHAKLKSKKRVRLGSLCTGYGGLDMAFMRVFDVLAPALAWVADNNRHASTLLAKRSPDVPNLGDLEHVDWRLIDPVDAVCAGFPCQDISFAGLGAGIAHCVGN